MNTGLNKKRISQKFKKLLKNSLIVRFLLFLSEFFYSKITHSKIAQLFSSYSETGKCYNNSFLKFVVSKVGLKKNTRLIIKNKIQKNIENSIFYRAVCSLSDILLSAKVRMYGIALFIFGFCSVAAGLIKTYVSFSHGDDYFLIFQGALLVFIGFAFLFYKNSMGHLLYNSKIIWFLLHDIAGIEEEKTVRPTAKENTVLPVLLGLFLGLTSIVIDPIYIFVAFFAIIYIIFVFYKPEFGILVTIVTVPFLPTMLICFEILLAFASFLLKVLRGKRSIYFGLLDICVAVFAILMLLGGIFSAYPKTSIQASCVFVCFILSYFLVVNLVKSVSSLKKMIFLLSLSFFACSFLGVWQNFFGIADTTWTDVEMFEEINTRVVSTFENPNVFGEYLIMMAPMVLSLFFIGKGFKRKCVPALVFITGCAALVFTWSRGAWLGFIFSLILYLIIVNKKIISFYLIALISLPLVYQYLPSAFQSRISSIGNMSDSSTSYRVYIWEASFNMLKDWWFSGIGVGTGSFAEIYPLYSLAGIETAPHSHNLYFQIFLELGIFGIITFLTIIFFALSKCCTYLITGKQRDIKLISSAAMMGIMAILVQGLTDYVWYNYRVFLVFWIVIAIMSVSINLARKEDLHLNSENETISGGKNEKSEISIQI